MNSFAFYGNNIKNTMHGYLSVGHGNVIGKAVLERMFMDKN